MKAFQSLDQWVDNIENLNRKAAYRALNKSVAKTNTQLKRRLVKDFGMKAGDIGRRIRVRQANTQSLKAYVSVGTKHGLGFELFKPRLAKVKKKGRIYNGVSVVVPALGSRFILLKSFVATFKNNNASLVVHRRTRERGSVERSRLDTFKIVDKHRPELTKFMLQDFIETYPKQLKFLTEST